MFRLPEKSVVARLCGVAGLIFAVNSPAAVLLSDDFSDGNIHHMTDSVNNVTHQDYWESAKGTLNGSLAIAEEADGNGGNQLVVTSSDVRGGGILFDAWAGSFYDKIKTPEVSPRAVNFVDPEMDFFNAERVFVLDKIQIQGAQDGRFHHLLFALTSLGTQAFDWYLFEVRVSMNGQVRVRSVQKYAKPGFISLVPEQLTLPSTPSRIELRVNATQYQIKFDFDVASTASRATSVVDGQVFHTLQGGSLSYTGQHGMSMTSWRNTLNAANGFASPETVGSAIFIGAQSTSADLGLPIADRETTVRVGNFTVSDNQP